MKILTDKDKSVAIAALEGSELKRSTFCGRYDIKVLKELVSALESGFDAGDSVDLYVIYSPVSDAHVMMIPIDQKKKDKCIVMGGHHHLGQNGEDR
jgi:hypothetical protein